MIRSNHEHLILYVDDDPALLNVVKTYLEGRTDIIVMTAGCVREALAMLKTFSFDVILSDYQMPGIDGIGFLKILQENECRIPFILFTGMGREEVVIEAINNGATSYIQKGGSPRAQFAELEHKIREISRRRRAEEALLETELQYRTLFEYSGTAIMILDDDMVISRVNTEFSHLTGYAKDEVEGVLRWTDIIDIGDCGKLLERYRLLRKGAVPAINRFEFQIITKDRQTRKFLATIAFIPTTWKCIVSLIDCAFVCPSEDAFGNNREEVCGIPNIA